MVEHCILRGKVHYYFARYTLPASYNEAKLNIVLLVILFQIILCSPVVRPRLLVLDDIINSLGSDEEETSNEYLEAHYQKLGQVKTKLQFMNATNEAEHVEAELKKIRTKRFIQKYWFYFLFAFILIALYILK